MMPAIGPHSTATSEAAWDGPANAKRARSGESQDYYRRIYAWRDGNQEGDRKAHYRFVHHFVAEGGEPGAASTVASTAGIAVLNGARGGTTIPEDDRQGVYNHLARHLRDADIEPPELRSAEDVRECSLMTMDDFRQGRELPPGGVLLRKQFVAKVEPSPEHKGLYQFTISTGDVDRDDDRINPAGWDFKHYMRNPVVLFAHNYTELPVGRTVDVFTADNKVKALTEFTPADLYEFGDQIRRFYEAGFLNAVSVGFLPRAWNWVDSDERKFGIDFEEQELLEFSAVPVPANPGALYEGPAKGLDLEPLRALAREVLQHETQPPAALTTTEVRQRVARWRIRA
jgi:HK97 family phage prohead protease